MTTPISASASLGPDAPRGGSASDPAAPMPSFGLCVAPMMAYTDRHCRVLHRLLAPAARLYTEMVSVDALLHGNREQLLSFSAMEHPVALQLGGSDVRDLARAARLGAEAGFDEVNLNVGCPSSRVQKGAFGACLMRRPGHVATAVAAMRDAATVPITVKCRLGVEQSARDGMRTTARDYETLRDFVDRATEAGAAGFIVHARKAVLDGLTPAQNRSVPPLEPDIVKRLKADCPHVLVVYNGGLRDSATVRERLTWADGVMIGRGAYQNPRWLARLHAELFAAPATDVGKALGGYLAYVDSQLRRGVPLHRMSRHMLTLFNGMAGARRYRQHLTTHDRRPNAGIDVIRAAIAHVRDAPVSNSAALAA